MIKPSLHFQARKGESVVAAWQRLSAAMKNDTLKMVSNPSLRRRITPHGTVIKYLSPATWDHPFRVSANDEYVQVAPGTVNGLMPYITDAYTGEWVRLNGLNNAGLYIYENGTVGVMKMDKEKINDDFGMYVMLRIKRNKNTGLVGLKLDENKGTTVIEPEDLQVRLEKEYEGPDGGANSEFGYHPLGFIQWNADGSAVTSVSQVCHFNLKYDFQDRRASLAELKQDPKVPTYGRHIFWPQ